MIAQGNAISHGARAIEYSMEKDKACQSEWFARKYRAFGYVVTDDAAPAPMYERQV